MRLLSGVTLVRDFVPRGTSPETPDAPVPAPPALAALGTALRTRRDDGSPLTPPCRPQSAREKLSRAGQGIRGRLRSRVTGTTRLG